MKKILVSVIVSIALIGMFSGEPRLSLAQTPTPVSGGILKGMRFYFPKNLGYIQEWAPADFISALPWAERLVHWDQKGKFVPNLLESWKIDTSAMTIVYHLRKGVTFHDGSLFDAEVLKANLEANLKTGRIADGEFLKSIEIIDRHTLRLNLSELTSASMLNYAFNVQVVSVLPLKNLEKNGHGQME